MLSPQPLHRPDDLLGQRVGAIVHPREGATPQLSELDAHVRETLAGYKVPRSLWLVDEIGRQNVMIKIPATPPCIPAIEEAIYRGVNINVTKPPTREESSQKAIAQDAWDFADASPEPPLEKLYTDVYTDTSS